MVYNGNNGFYFVGDLYVENNGFCFVQHGNDGFFRQTCAMLNTIVIDVFVVVYQHGRS